MRYYLPTNESKSVETLPLLCVAIKTHGPISICVCLYSHTHYRRVRWHREGSYRDALDYFNRPDNRRRADVTDGGRTLVIYKVRRSSRRDVRPGQRRYICRYFRRTREHTTVKWKTAAVMKDAFEQRSDSTQGSQILTADAVNIVINTSCINMLLIFVKTFEKVISAPKMTTETSVSW